MNNPTTFYIVRHGETQWNVEGRVQGHGDSPLTDNGKHEIAELEQHFHEIHFDHVFSSDLLRAQQTAELLTIRKKLAVNTTALLREFSFGSYEGKTRQEYEDANKELFRQYQALSGEEQWTFKYADDMESDEEVVQRLLIFLREAAITYKKSTILVVTHGGALRILLKHLGKLIVAEKGSVQNLAYVKLLSNGIDFEITETNGVIFSDQ